MTNWPLIFSTIVSGAQVTVIVTLGAAALGLIVAFGTGLLEASPRRWVRVLGRSYIEVFRGSSAIVQLFLFFYVLPAFGIHLPAIMVGIVALGLNMGAYGSQVVRAGIEGVDRGQREAAISLNLSPTTTLWRIIMPQAFRTMLPTFGNELIETLKLSAVVSLITLNDITFSGKVLLQTLGDGQSLPIYGSVLIAYFILALPVIFLIRHLEVMRSRGWVKQMKAGAR